MPPEFTDESTIELAFNAAVGIIVILVALGLCAVMF